MKFNSENDFFNALCDLLSQNGYDTSSVILNNNKTSQSVTVDNQIYCSFPLKDKRYIAFKKNNINLLNEHSVPYTENKSYYIRVFVPDSDTLNKYSKAIIDIFDDIYSRGSDSFSCCHLYKKCSDAMQCVNSDKKFSMKCHYRRKLKKGIVYYGKNAVQSIR